MALVEGLGQGRGFRSSWAGRGGGRAGLAEVVGGPRWGRGGACGAPGRAEAGKGRGLRRSWEGRGGGKGGACGGRGRAEEGGRAGLAELLGGPRRGEGRGLRSSWTGRGGGKGGACGAPGRAEEGGRAGLAELVGGPRRGRGGACGAPLAGLRRGEAEQSRAGGGRAGAAGRPGAGCAVGAASRTARRAARPARGRDPGAPSCCTSIGPEAQGGRGLPAPSVPCPCQCAGGPRPAAGFLPLLHCPLTSSHGTPAWPAAGSLGGPASGPGSGLPRVCLQRGQLLQPYALSGHGHLLHDHEDLLHPLPDESEQVLRAQLLRDRVRWLLQACIHDLLLPV